MATHNVCSSSPGGHLPLDSPKLEYWDPSGPQTEGSLQAWTRAWQLYHKYITPILEFLPTFFVFTYSSLTAELL